MRRIHTRVRICHARRFMQNKPYKIKTLGVYLFSDKKRLTLWVKLVLVREIFMFSESFFYKDSCFPNFKYFIFIK